MKWRHRSICAFNILLVVTTHLAHLIGESACTPQPLQKPFIDRVDVEIAISPIAEQYLYVDKTIYVLNLLQSRGRMYFLARPRKFGKSIFVQTLRKVFEGRKDIFPKTHIYESDYKWEAYPVLHFFLGGELHGFCGGVVRTNHTRLEKKVESVLEDFKAEHKLLYPKKSDVAEEFTNILREIYERKGNSTVVLIDDYDYPILANMRMCPEAAQINKLFMKDLISLLQTNTNLIRFAFVTGNTKALFASVGCSSSFIDITNHPDFHGIAGLSELDVKDKYKGHIALTSQYRNISEDSVVDGILKHYYGYNFSGTVDFPMGHPGGVQDFFQLKIPQVNWISREYGTFLFNQILRRPAEFSRLNLEAGVKSNLKGGSSLDDTAPEVLLYDASYLTIQTVESEGRTKSYILGFPSAPMEQKFHEDIATQAMFYWSDKGVVEPFAQPHLIQYQFHEFMRILRILFTRLTMRPPYKNWYVHQLNNVLRRVRIHCEMNEVIQTTEFADRQIDIVAESPSLRITFLFEVKLDEPDNRKAWAEAKKSAKMYLDHGNKKGFNLLAAGITFTSDLTKDPVVGYRAKIFAPDGSVCRSYRFRNESTLAFS